ncbi:DNA-binding protein [Dyadobacter sp. LHD-138]|uniref:DNA-binding protein n=1 Tax=Dyadobacter sp. LHD-138 TaxID=3071413 RepID=UPI0027E1DFEE|nr:DNA-binding protein [Dyadobacter sp. LHD-138]MDQ6477650.1 DNA-binding protein [Dyadobacter sp. LHD-138]
MSKNLTESSLDRKNILNNNFAVQEVYEHVGFYGIKFDGRYRFTKQQVAHYYEVDARTIDRLLENHKEEFEQSGYELYNGSTLRRFKDQVFDFVRVAKESGDVHDIHVVNILQLTDNELDSLSKTPQLGIFTYKAFLNIGMLLTGSENAQRLRTAILDIVIDVLNKKLGGKTKFINQREEEFLPSLVREYNYRQEFTNALDYYITDNRFKYSQLTDKIYKCIFKENAKEYRQILNLNAKESVRSTMYSEVLDLIAGYENGYANYLKNKSESLERKLSLSEAHLLFAEFEKTMEAFVNPLREKARSLMASRDLAFRDALHEKLKEYVNEVSSEDFEKFLGERSMDLEKRLEDNKDVFKRLKDR